MGINFYFANNFEKLSEEFLRTIEEEKDRTNLFSSPTIILPNKNLVKHFKLYFAKKQNICLNFNFTFFENGITDLLLKIKNSNEKVVLLNDKTNHTQLQLMILSSISLSNGLDMIKKFIGDKDSKSYIKKLWQLSDKLASLFKEYEYQREDMVKKWLTSDTDSLKDQIEKEEAIIYKNIFKNGGLLDKINNESKDVRYTNLTNFIGESLGKDEIKTKDPKEYIYFFGFSQISKFHYDVIIKLSEFYNVRFFNLNYLNILNDNTNDNTLNVVDWKNVKKDNKVIPDKNENPLLEKWATPSRENIKILEGLLSSINASKKPQVNSYWIQNDKTKIENPSVLNILQSNILNNTLLDTKKQKIAQDNSIEIINAFDIFREIETVYNSIIHNMAKNPNLRLTDIALLVPNMKKYSKVIRAIFLRENSPISFNLTDINAKDESLFGKALIGMLNIPQSNFGRKDLIDLLENEIFQVANGLEEDDVTTYIEWIESLNIFGGYGGNDTSLYSWNQAFTRLKLGAIMEYEEDEKFSNYDGIVPYNDLGILENSKVDKFVKTFERLFDKLLVVKDHQKDKNYNIKKQGLFWANYIKELINEFLSIPERIDNKLKTEINVMHSILLSLQDLEFYDQIQEDNEPLNVDYIIEFLSSNLEGINTSIGSYLTDGVTISSLMPLRPIPFKIVYVVGLGEGDFPGEIYNSNIDIREQKRAIGDITKPEANKYLFLETIISVREKLYLSYIGKDIEKDEQLFPNSLLVELKNYIEENIIKENNNKGTFEESAIPLQSYSNKYFEERENHCETVVNYDKNSNLLSLYNLSEKYPNLFDKTALEKITNDFEEQTKKLTYETSKDSSDNKDDNSDKEIEEDANRVVTIKELADFLINPLKQKLRRHLNIYIREEEDYSLNDSEPFYSVFPLKHNLPINTTRHYIKNELTNNDDKEDTYNYFEKYLKNESYKSNTPNGEFLYLAKLEFREGLERRIKFEKKSLDDLIKTISDQNLLESYELPQFELCLNEIKAKIIAKMDKNIFVSKNNNSLNFLIVTNSEKPKSKKITKHIFYPFLLGLAHFIQNENSNKSFNLNLHTIYKDEIILFKYKIEIEQAKKYLNGLIDYYFENELYYEPDFAKIEKLKIDTKDGCIWDNDNFNEDEKATLQGEKNEYQSFSKFDITSLIKAELKDDYFEIFKNKHEILYKFET